uniref:DsbA family protein n=1 Tax=Marinobacterium profundum TaxID=1714300 RepID=UPI0009E7A78D|nr:DsbA family protein [Marinobacterium profundum]
MKSENSRIVQPLIATMVAIVISLVAGLALADSHATTSTSTAPAASAPLEETFEQRVRDYILSHPEVVVEAFGLWQAQQQAQKQGQIKATIAERRAEIFEDPDAPVGGNPEGDVTLVEFFDYNCPYCKKVAPVMAALAEADSKLRFVYKEFPILGPASDFAARAALAAREQGKYLELHHALMTSDTRLTETKVLELARALNITGTPGFVIGSEVLGGAADRRTFETLIERARQAQ